MQIQRVPKPVALSFSEEIFGGKHGVVQTASQTLFHMARTGYFSTTDALGGCAWLPAILLFKAQGPRQAAEAGHNPYRGYAALQPSLLGMGTGPCVPAVPGRRCWDRGQPLPFSLLFSPGLGADAASDTCPESSRVNIQLEQIHASGLPPCTLIASCLPPICIQ